MKSPLAVLLITALSPVLLVSHADFVLANEGPCMEDAKKLCPGVEHREGRVMHCLREHEAQLSEGCKTKMAQRKAHREERQEMRKAKRIERAEKRLERMKRPQGVPPQ